MGIDYAAVINAAGPVIAAGGVVLLLALQGLLWGVDALAQWHDERGRP